MGKAEPQSVWADGDGYEPYVGRWSRPVAQKFLQRLDLPTWLTWLDLGCGTGALTQTILAQTEPREVQGVDPSEGYLAVARRQVKDPRASFQLGKAGELPFTAAKFDAVVSGLVLNFVPNVESAMHEIRRVTKPNGTIAAYVWDYAGKMELMRYFWDAVVALKPDDRPRDEGVRFPLCSPAPLQTLFESSGLHDVEVHAIDIPTNFRDFDDYWRPFLGGQFPAPAYAMALNEEDRQTLRERIRSTLPIETDGSIRLIARAWAVRGSV